MNHDMNQMIQFLLKIVSFDLFRNRLVCTFLSILDQYTVKLSNLMRTKSKSNRIKPNLFLPNKYFPLAECGKI